MTKSDDKRVPALRFKGFTDEWEQRKLGDIFKKDTEKNIQNQFSEKKTISVSSMRFNIHGNGASKESIKKYKILRKGDIAFEGHTNNNFKFGRFVVNDVGDGIMSPRFAALRPLKNENTLFRKYYFHFEPIMRHILVNSTKSGTMMNELVYSDLFKQTINMPQNEEQNKLGALFAKLDEIVELQQRKVNDLNSMKSALLQDVFPNTQGIKKIKLSTQEWNLQKISSIFKERNQRNKNGMLLSVSISKGVYPFSENDRKDNSSNDKSNYKEVKINDLAYNSMRMWQGAVGVSKYNGIVSPAYTVITPKKEENPNFYYYYFKNKRMLFNFRQHSQGLTSDTWNLKFPLFEKILIQVPSDKEEEQRISSLFKQIDKSIELSKIQIKKLTSIKQFLLQNMFI